MARAPRSLTLPRMNAHRLVVAAAALTVAVAAALAVALATFSGQALPRAVRHDLGQAPGTPMLFSGSVSAAQAAQYSTVLPRQISAALDGTAFGFYRAEWSDPLGFVPGSRPAAPASGGSVPIAEAATFGGLAGQAELVSGSWPGPARPGGQPIPAALPIAAAALLRVRTGDVLQLRDRITQGDVRFIVTGLYRPRQVSAPYWELDQIAAAGSSTASGFTTYGPLAVAAAAFAGPLAVNQGSWLATPQTASIPASRLTAVAANVTGLREALLTAQQLPTLTVSTGLPAVLEGTASDLDVARSLLAICAVLLFLLAGATLLATARLLAGQREGESAMLAARGASRWQLAATTAAEAVPLSVLAAALGTGAGLLLARLLDPGSAAGPGPTAGTWLAAAAVTASAVVIMLVPALSTVTPGTARARRGRQAAISGVTRAGADLALVLLAVLAGWQLRHYSAVSAGANGNYGIDPVVVIAPALALAGGTVVALRLLPAAGRAGDRLAARGRRLTAALASWQISRQPIRQGGAALLIVLAVATATLALSQRQSWATSDRDQAAFTAGADVRADVSQPLSAAQAAGLTRQPGVMRAMPVATFAQPAAGSEVLALDSGQAADVTLLRADQSRLAPAALFGTIAPSGPAPGVALPGRSAQAQLAVRLGPATLRLAGATVNVSVQDADHDVYQLDAGSLPADGRDHTLSVTLAGPSGALFPLRLTAVSVDYTLPARASPEPATFTVDGFSAGPGTAQRPGAALGAWAVTGSSTELAGVRQEGDAAGPTGMPAVTSRSAAGGVLSVTFQPGYGQAASPSPGALPVPVGGELTLTGTPPVAALPGIATQGFLAASNTSVGSVVQATINGAILSVRIVAAVTTFPTVTSSGGALIVDLGQLQEVLSSSSLAAVRPDQWWLAIAAGSGAPAGSGVPAGLGADLPPGSAVTSRAAVAAGLLGDPLSTVPQQALLAVTFAAAVLAITGFWVAIAAGVRQRRAENALLAALGVPPRSAAGQLFLEKLMLSLPAAAAGLILGVVLAELLVPAITLTSSASTPVPPVLIQFGWPQTLAVTVVVAVLPVLAAALTLARRPDAAAELRAAEAA